MPTRPPACPRCACSPAGPGLREARRWAGASLSASHPPAGLRAEMLERRPQRPAAVTLTAAESARIGAELAPYAERVRLALTE
ncbi:hypothetical protein [Actinoplanes sp. NPDC048796]|uniref:hypothetical protein n=1 Tax=Actinoplanes sp. NPDC048796 TaxID=3155640 RepID=UPI0033FF1E26